MRTNQIMKDLTKGKPSVLILTFALPIFLANLLQLTYSIVDTRIVGTFLGENMLAAVGATTTLSNLIIGFLLGLSNGFAIVTAQKFGAKDYKGMRRFVTKSLLQQPLYLVFQRHLYLLSQDLYSYIRY